MRKLELKRITIISDSTKSARQLEFGKHLTLITASDNSVGKSTLAKMIFWSFGCDPIFSDEWRMQDCRSIIEFEVDEKPFSIVRYKNEISILEQNGKVIKYDKISGSYAELFSKIVGFDVLLPKRNDFSLEIPPPAFYFLPFYIDQKRTWIKPWDSFENLQQYSGWTKPVISFHAGIYTREHFSIEKKVYTFKKESDEIRTNITELNNAAITLKESIESIYNDSAMSENIELNFIENEKEKRNLLEKLTELQSQKIDLSSQIALANSIINELDKDYIFSVECFDEGNIECPTCGTIHENSIASRAGILIDLESAKEQLDRLKLNMTNLNLEISYSREELNILSKAMEVAYNNMLKNDSFELISFSNKSLDKRIDKVNTVKSEQLEDKIKGEKIAKKSQKALLTPEKKEAINTQFIEYLNKYVTKLRVNIDIRKIKTPLDYKKIYDVGGAAEDTRAVLSYYLAMYDQINKFCSEAIPPLVIDTPNQHEQAEENYKKIIKVISEETNSNKQYILCAMENTALDLLKPKAEVIILDNNRILLHSEYTQASSRYKQLFS